MLQSPAALSLSLRLGMVGRLRVSIDQIAGFDDDAPFRRGSGIDPLLVVNHFMRERAQHACEGVVTSEFPFEFFVVAGGDSRVGLDAPVERSEERCRDRLPVGRNDSPS